MTQKGRCRCFVAKDEVEDEVVTFTKMEEIYETAIDEAKKINKGKLRALQLERAVRLAA